mgnify:CR=1 FL=1
MGITALFIIALLVLILVVSNIPKLTLMKKILIIVSVLLACFGILAYIFITGFERGRRPTLEDLEQEAIQNQKPDSTIAKTPEKELKTHPENNIEKSRKLLFDIEGEYFFKAETTGCKMNLTLYYANNQLKYKLKTNTREISDNATLQLNERKDGYYITFENIEWSEYLGALDEEGNPIEENLSLPQEISGELNENEIIIQNYGNAMNYYMKLGECDVKYLYLIRNLK